MQKGVRVDEGQLLLLGTRARTDHSIAGNLYKKSSDNVKWKQRWFTLYQNLLFFYENDSTLKPLGVILLEGCYSERQAPPKLKEDKQYWHFVIHFRYDAQRQYELRSETEAECNAWMDAIQHSNFEALLLQKEEIEQKYLHLLQILDSEKTAKLSLRQQCEELSAEITRLKTEVNLLHWKARRWSSSSSSGIEEEEPENIKKIKRVQSFIRGWLCRRRWKSIVQDYIRSPHAESMRKRNHIVFGMVECEREYVEQLSTLMSSFVRPLKMAASAKKPIISHEDANSIFLNSETIFFLHQIFYKGLCARMENWPTLVLGDLFDMLLPMLSIYNEYVRNHHFSLQVLAECKQHSAFNLILKQYEAKPVCEGRSLETFLTYPMHQVPRYIITLHELLAHTPHDHVERSSLEHAKNKLEELSLAMQDEVSETESIRKNLSIERMIIEGCDILLDVEQTFVRQGSLIQVSNDRNKTSRNRLGSLGSSRDTKKEGVRQCFLFTKHLLVTTRTSGGKLHLNKIGGILPLMDTTIVEEFDPFDDEVTNSKGSDYDDLDFRVVVDSKSGPPLVISLVAPTLQDKAAWTSDISQCIDNLHYNGLLDSSADENSLSSVRLPHCIKSDPRLFKDDEDIRFSKLLNSCKVPQIRYASLERLLERLTDLRFLSIDFLNTFLLTYRIITDWKAIVNTLTGVYKNPDIVESQLNVTMPPPPPSPGPYRHDGKHNTPPTSPRRYSSGAALCKLSDSPSKISPIAENSTDFITCSDDTDFDTELEYSPRLCRQHRKASDSQVVGRYQRSRHSPPDSPSIMGSTDTPPTSPYQLTADHLSPKRVLHLSRSDSNIAALSKGSKSASEPSTAASSNIFQFGTSPPKTTTATAGVVVTSSRMSTRRASCSTAALAFAAATAGASNIEDSPDAKMRPNRGRRKFVRGRGKLQSSLSKDVISSAATVRVINVIRHWVSKFAQDFESNHELRTLVKDFLEEIVGNPNLLPSEHKGALIILRQLKQEHIHVALMGEAELMELASMQPPAEDSFTVLPALELAEQLTYIEHKLLRAIPFWEFLSQKWMKQDKVEKAPHILALTRRFNEVSKLVASEILRQKTSSSRAAAIEKWAAVADICRCMHNFNTVLEITSALMNSSVYRLKRVWDKVSKTTKTTLEKLQILVSSDGRFKNMREALHRIDPPCVPYLGFYLTDLAFIEDASPNITEDNLINFSKMRMIAHVIQEVRHFQQTPYSIAPNGVVISYLTDVSLIMDDDEMYALSLELEPRQSTRPTSSI
ncbi:ras-specific guanine nucleotide-releasing factor 2-like [Apostichopus japonicus]|uniref:ras-specific guanine nucleotide-releasing factor 2-like n=1 Tax=Stichopus japonicus TaxID=307972 RepID=UPI003AB4DF55